MSPCGRWSGLSALGTGCSCSGHAAVQRVFRAHSRGSAGSPAAVLTTCYSLRAAAILGLFPAAFPQWSFWGAFFALLKWKSFWEQFLLVLLSGWQGSLSRPIYSEELPGSALNCHAVAVGFYRTQGPVLRGSNFFNCKVLPVSLGLKIGVPLDTLVGTFCNLLLSSLIACRESQFQDWFAPLL